MFALLPSAGQSLVSLASIYRWAESQRFTADAEHVIVHGVPVHILPAYNSLVIEAIHTAQVHEYEGIPVRVVDPEHLIALALSRRCDTTGTRVAPARNGHGGPPAPSAILDVHGIHAEIPGDD